jgi:lysylphosphatidylglycerol synthetase-like protein (DUF2156 family)
MIEHGVEALWFPYERAYAVVTACWPKATLERSELSHTEAMRLAVGIREEGATVSVLHVIGDKSFEVDRYPPR